MSQGSPRRGGDARRREVKRARLSSGLCPWCAKGPDIGRARRRVSKAGSGPAARAPSRSGRKGSPGGGWRLRTSCGRSARPTRRSCRPGVAVPALSTLGGFPHLEPLIVSMADHDSCTHTYRASAQFMVRRSAHDAVDGWSAPRHFRPSGARGLWAEPLSIETYGVRK